MYASGEATFQQSVVHFCGKTSTFSVDDSSHLGGSLSLGYYFWLLESTGTTIALYNFYDRFLCTNQREKSDMGSVYWGLHR